MPQQVLSSVENNFTKGLITESTGLNFPENAATDTDNCVYTLVGDVTRRLGINTELNGVEQNLDRDNKAVATYVWSNAGGDGVTKILVKQIGNTLYFYNIGTATVTSPLSSQLLSSTIMMSAFSVAGVVFDPSVECQFADGNGYLFVFNTNCEPFFCNYNAGVITGNIISLQIRDFAGIPETLGVNTRPNTLTAEHTYNLVNQGWTAGNPWSTYSDTTWTANTGSAGFTVGAGLPVTLGDVVAVVTVHGLRFRESPGNQIATGTVTAYTGTSMTINVFSVSAGSAGQTYVLGGTPFGVNSDYSGNPQVSPMLQIVPVNHGYINTWFAAEGNYPSNADVWWYFKDTSNNFNPAVTQPQVTLNIGQAPQGHLVFSAFNQDRSVASGVGGLTPVKTNVRPSSGTWFQGRVWYTGVNAQQQATGDAGFYSWTENIYFSQVVNDPTDFGHCYQVNDPTSETLFDLLPTDGGVIRIPGCGSIFKLFPIANGMLIFASNGVYFITGSQGIGFSANDYTVTQLSQVQSISGTSFVNVLGLPYFWNEEGIYQVAPQQGGQLSVEPITVGTIQSFYDAIPFASKKFVRGAYNPIEYTIQWAYRSEIEQDVTTRYQFDSILNYNTYNKAFYPFSISSNTSQSHIHGINFITYPQIFGNTPEPGFKYVSSRFFGQWLQSFAEEYDTNHVDWGTEEYESFFITGYKVHGHAQKRFQIPYLYMYYRLNDERNASYVQGIWDYATSGDTGRWSTAQLVNIYNPKFSIMQRRLKFRGQGLVLQIKVSSVDNLPFDIIGWSVYETLNQGV